LDVYASFPEDVADLGGGGFGGYVDAPLAALESYGEGALASTPSTAEGDSCIAQTRAPMFMDWACVKGMASVI
jgi:hypothetical protein